VVSRLEAHNQRMVAEARAYEEGYEEGWADCRAGSPKYAAEQMGASQMGRLPMKRGNPHTKKRKLSAWNKFVKANSKKPRFVYRNGKLNLKKMGVAFRKTPAGKKKR